jgi:putative hydrolase of the HAD superfamily
MIIPKNACWVFDLDDTLYKEVDYQKSGFKAVIDMVRRLYNIDVVNLVEESHTNGLDVFEEICLYLNLPLSNKESFLWYYRLHKPDIELSADTKITLQAITNNSRHTAIITDGRVLSQKFKIDALGLSKIPSFVSDEWGEIKPGINRFLHVMKTLQADRYIYVGDNIKKDFIAPNELGWITIGIVDDGSNIHKQDMSIDKSYQPMIWIESFSEIDKYLL